MFLKKDSKIELREDFNKLKILSNNLKNETDLLKINFQELLNNCKWERKRDSLFFTINSNFIHRLLIQQTTDILSERNYYYSEWEYSKNILTPR